MPAPDEDLRSDAQLLAAAGEDAEAFGVFYDRHVRVLLGFFYRRTLCAEMAADLTAETFAAAFINRRRYRDTGAPTRAWLLGIGRRELSRALRKQRVETRARERLGLPRLEVDDQSLERIEELVDVTPLVTAVKQALSSMSPKLADAVLLRVAHDLPYEEVAARLGCSEGAARVRVARGLARLEELLEVSG
ncbi:RNA polymerase sigma factor [Lentzea alba]|uniref:RNA polymerase sigma factor n=1 Tax=Lentzea alba TaxID=2714351 RepID=UPI0039BFB6ED